MKKQAFYLVAGIIASQLIIVSGVLVGCFLSKAKECTGDRVSELMTYITAQAFALYAAEKRP